MRPRTPLRAQPSGARRVAERALTPRPVDTDTDVIDTSRGTVHLVVGAGGTSIPSNRRFFADARCRVLVGVGELNATGHRAPRYVEEEAPWLAFRDLDHPCGFMVFDVDPGAPGEHTTMTAHYLAVRGPFGDTAVVDRFTLTRPRRG